MNSNNTNNMQNAVSGAPKITAFTEQLKEKMSGFFGRTFDKLIGKRVSTLVEKAVPSELMHIDKIREKVHEVEDKVANVQQDMVQTITKNALNSAERAVYVVPFAGGIAAAITAVDSVVAAGRNAAAGIGEVKKKVEEIKSVVDEANQGLNAASSAAEGGLSGLNNLSPQIPQMKVPDLPQVPTASSILNKELDETPTPPATPSPVTETPIKGGGKRVTKKNRSSRSEKILIRAKKSIDQFYGGAKITVTAKPNKNNKKKTTEKKALKIMHRTRKALSRFYG
jgi:flagellar hook-associated protein FlgK